MTNKYLITGGAGFIGSHLVDYILELYPRDKIIVLDKLTYAGNKKNLDLSKITLIEGDINDKALVSKILNTHKINAVFNLAAETHVDRSIDDGSEFINSNLCGVFNLLEECNAYFKLNGPEFRFIQISTDEVYGSSDHDEYFDESSPYNPSSVYSASKAGGDYLALSYFKTYRLPVIVTNCTNNYGPRQFPEKLIPKTIERCMTKSKIPVYGRGTNIRDWIHVKDHCSALYAIMKDGIPGQRYNIGSDNYLTNNEIVNAICDIFKTSDPAFNYHGLIEHVEDRKGHDFKYSINSAKLRKELGWSPTRSFKDELQSTVDYYLKKTIVNNTPGVL